MENKFLKLISVILVAVLLINMLPMSIFAEEFRESLTEKPEKLEASTDISGAEIIEELPEKRTEYTKEFLLSNGLHLAAVYSNAIHYQENGNWQEIDNTLIAKTDGKYTNTAGVWDVSFPQQLSGAKNVMIEKDGHTLSFAMAGELRGSIISDLKTFAAANGEPFSLQSIRSSTAEIRQIDKAKLAQAYAYAEIAPVKQQSRLAYDNVFLNTDIVYDLDANTVKESVVIAAYSDTLRGYRYTLEVGTMVPVQEEDGQITFYDSSRENVVMVMPAPYLVDDAGAHNADIQVQLTGSGSKYTLSYLLPQRWLAEADRAWPVVLDPVVTADLNVSNIRDRTVCELTTHAQNWGMLDAGYSAQRGVIRSYLKYQNLPALSSSDVIIGATIQMCKYENSTYTASIEAHKVNGTWESETITWSNKPGFNTIVEDYAIVKNAGWYGWDITDIARDWYANQNTGVLFKASDDVETGGTDNFKQFMSSDYGSNKPVLAIWFRNNNGLEDYWDYTSSSAGRAGTGYINNYTGNLVWVHEDIGFGGNRMPVSIRHIYNANDAGTNQFAVGSGWRTNYNQLVYQWSVDSSYYVWEDADGTKHYFKYSSANTYKDEDGLELTLTSGGSGTQTYCIADKYGNKSYFDTAGRLARLQNNQQTPSSITITYTESTGSYISSITDGAGRTYSFQYAAGRVQKISYVGTGTTEIASISIWYDSGNLATIRGTDNRYCDYEYNEKNLLNAVYNNGDYVINYTYNTVAAGQPSRVSCVEETYDGILGGKLSIEYAHNQTTFTDHNGNVEIHQFNNFGNTVSIQDDEGHAQYTLYARNTGEDTGKSNQIRLSSKLQNTVSNYLRDNSFETGAPWYQTANVSMERSTETAYLGNYSLKVTSSTTGNTYGACSHDFYIPNGETVTFSAYVKTADAKAVIAIHSYDNSTNEEFISASDTIAAGQDWTREEVTFTNTSGRTLRMWCYLFVRSPGTVYIDCVQVEKAVTASRFNIIDNGDFRHNEYGWTRGMYFEATETYTTLSESAAPQLSNNVYKIQGNPSYGKHLYQTVNISGNLGDTYVLAGWAKGDSVPLGTDEGRQFALVAFFLNTDGSQTKRVVQFNPDTDSNNSWQYVSGVVIADKPYRSINIDCQYDFNANTAYFDGIQLYKEEFGSSYTYDNKGNVVSVTDLQKQTTSYEYDTASNLTKIIQNGNAKMTYTYDNYHNVKTATSQEGLVYNFAYDAYGNNTAVSISDGQSMTTTATYTPDGNRLVSTTDALGKVTAYGYNENTNVLDWVQYPEDTEDTRTEYTYDGMYRVATAACETDTGNLLSADYTYTDDRLTQIETASTTYGFSYGDFYQRTGVSVGNRTLATYNYTDDRNRYLSSLDYGNGDSVNYTYDNKGRVTAETYEDGDTVTYTYDNNGALAKVTDSDSGITTTYYYDFADRMMKYVESGTDYSHAVGYAYDTQNNLTRLVETINGVEHTTSYTYDDDNRVESVTNGAVSEHYTYDSFGRVSEQITKHNGSEVLAKSATFQSPESGKTSAQVATYTVESGGFDVTYTYTYDDNGNITSISDGTNTTSYAYDSANQLIREDNQAGGLTYIWTYDDAGNILSHSEYDYSLDEFGELNYVAEYSYEDGQWGDVLTCLDDNEILSDEIGNILDNDRLAFCWEHGRELASVRDGYITWTFAYNADGLRTKRTNGTDIYTYVYNGSQLSQMTKGSDTLYFTYDANGSPMSVTYNGTVYYYVTNLQGDVVAILNGTGTAVVNYTYNAWGQLLMRTGSMGYTLGVLNPLRYRGYVYDQETRLYYLQSRYYAPNMGRFLNADAFAATGQGLLGNNMFAYCGNNPVLNRDTQGTRHEISAGGAGYRDVTEEITAALREECKQIKTFQARTQRLATTRAPGDVEEMSAIMVVSSIIDFYHKVDHKAPWDIKRPKAWEETIGTRFPASGHTVLYDGIVMTPEMLGNFTYGYLGYHYGFPLLLLYGGSYYAAHFPIGGEDLDNELWDWQWITRGYSYAFLNR